MNPEISKIRGLREELSYVLHRATIRTCPKAKKLERIFKLRPRIEIYTFLEFMSTEDLRKNCSVSQEGSTFHLNLPLTTLPTRGPLGIAH